MHVDEYRAMVGGQMREDALQGAIEELARRLGWLVYHTHDSRRSAAGFPDLVMVRRGRLIFAELKSMRGKVSAAQYIWLEELRAATVYNARLALGPDGGALVGPEVFVWRPADWLDDSILEVLT